MAEKSRAQVENEKHNAEKTRFHKLENGDLFHDGYYAQSPNHVLEYQVYEKITPSKARCVWKQGNRHRMLQQVYNFSANSIVWKVQ